MPSMCYNVCYVFNTALTNFVEIVDTKCIVKNRNDTRPGLTPTFIFGSNKFLHLIRVLWNGNPVFLKGIHLTQAIQYV